MPLPRGSGVLTGVKTRSRILRPDGFKGRRLPVAAVQEEAPAGMLRSPPEPSLGLKKRTLCRSCSPSSESDLRSNAWFWTAPTLVSCSASYKRGRPGKIAVVGVSRRDAFGAPLRGSGGFARPVGVCAQRPPSDWCWRGAVIAGRAPAGRGASAPRPMVSANRTAVCVPHRCPWGAPARARRCEARVGALFEPAACSVRSRGLRFA